MAFSYFVKIEHDLDFGDQPYHGSAGPIKVQRYKRDTWAAINRAFLRILDPRDSAKKERIETLNSERGGVWRCHTQFNCTSVCPKKINLTDTITRLKRALLFPGRLLSS